MSNIIFSLPALPGWAPGQSLAHFFFGFSPPTCDREISLHSWPLPGWAPGQSLANFFLGFSLPTCSSCHFGSSVQYPRRRGVDNCSDRCTVFGIIEKKEVQVPSKYRLLPGFLAGFERKNDEPAKLAAPKDHPSMVKVSHALLAHRAGRIGSATATPRVFYQRMSGLYLISACRACI